MGVPVFFKWLSMRNPKFITDAHQPPQQQYDSGNPSVDNFYVDMNGLIHPSVNPRGQNIREPTNFQQQCENIFEYIDKLINIVRPKKLVYLAIDGVAPRAKMNQQRSRRFRASLEGDESQVRKQRLLQHYKRVGACTPEVQNYVNKAHFNSNLITPGTEFLSEVCNKIREYISDRLANHKFWRNLVVVFSDANCPGEGQHKIMEFIRQERGSEDYPPNQSHCIYGADADLIMLTLATHQPRFYVIREIVITANDKWCTNCGKRGHYFLDCARADSIQNQQKVAEKINAGSINVEFQFLRIKMVRQFLHLQFHKANVPFGYDLERIIDDFVFLCFFVGNDFLPHVPCLSIRQGGIDVLMRVYEYCLELMPGYLIDAGEVNDESLAIFLREMSTVQQQLIQEMINKEYNTKLRENMEKKVEQRKQQEATAKKSKKKSDSDQIEIDYHDPLASFKQELTKGVNQQLSLQDYSVFGHNVYTYKEKFYRQKFKIRPSEFLQLKQNICRSYIEALKWICRYYYTGVASWSWFYPFHYSPFFTDLKVVETIPFELGNPFHPFEQLMAVFPAKTADALPKCLQPLMTEPDSPICDYFPTSFKIDLVGKKFAWLGEVLLPFIDDKRLLDAMGDYQKHLNQQEAHRNRFGNDQIFVNTFGSPGKLITGSATTFGDSKSLGFEATRDTFEGQIQLKQVRSNSEVYQYVFKQPSGRHHNINLKEGLHIQTLEELNQDIIGRTDRKAFGGQRFLRVIERSLGKRGGLASVRRQHRQNNNQRGRNDDRRRNRKDREYEDRNRDGNRQHRGQNLKPRHYKSSDKQEHDDNDHEKPRSRSRSRDRKRQGRRERDERES